MLWRRWGVFRFDMVTISFVSKDNEGNQNLLPKDRQAGDTKKPVGAGLPAIASGCSAVNIRALSPASRLLQVVRIVDKSGLFDFDRTLPTVDVALAGAGYRQLRLIHILVDG